MKLRDEFLEFVRDRWTRGVVILFVPLTVLVSIYSAVSGRFDILWLSIYAFIVIFLFLNSLYILLAQEKMPALAASGKNAIVKRVAKFFLLIPYARAVLIVSILLIPFFGFVAPVNQPVDVFLHGTPTLTPSIMPTPTWYHSTSASGLLTIDLIVAMLTVCGVDSKPSFEGIIDSLSRAIPKKIYTVPTQIENGLFLSIISVTY